MLIAKSWVERLVGQAQDGFTATDEDMDKGFVRVGFETEGYEPIAQTTGPLVIGRVEKIEELTGFKKPIRHCQVNVGDANGTGELQSIVCGARNFREGSTVVVSLPGAVLPGDFAISARETYGRMSAGMICSAAELGLASAQNKGIITLDPAVGAPGDDARPVLGLEDTVFDVNVTPDRGYALSARGLSREIASAFETGFVDIAEDPFTTVPEIKALGLTRPDVSGAEVLSVTVEQDTKCDRFGVCLVEGIDPSAESPFWLQRELMLCGQRPVNAATDVTNYVMMLLGQPMHAFDADKLTGGLTVRRAAEGEKLLTLDEVERALHAEDVVICDEAGVQSLAGVMGGTTSEISDETVNVFFEAAHWDPITVARTSRRHKLSSEASRRFERGVDPALVEVALDLAAALLVAIAGGSVNPGRTLVGEVRDMPVVEMKISRPSDIAGVQYSEQTVLDRLAEVGCAVERDGETLRVVPPTWRPDITMSADLVEEVLRLEGLEDIPSIVPTAPAGRGLTAAQLRRRAIGHALAYTGFAEILPTPFTSNDVFDVWGLDADDERRRTVKVLNPLDADYAQLGSTLLPSMLEALKRNVARGTTSVALFGLEQVSIAQGEGRSPMLNVAQRPDAAELEDLLNSLPQQPLHVATVACGLDEFDGPWGKGRPFTYADAIESARVVARAADVELDVVAGAQLPWHPGRCAELRVGDVVVGYAGELHPQVLERAGLPERTCAMELNVSALPFAPSAPAPVLSAFPALLQDVALIVDKSVSAEEVRRVVEEAAGELVENVALFDVYTSEALGEDKKSLAYALTFRAPDRTLTDDECSAARLAAVEAAEKAFGAQLRG
ncbi:phenylalanine--tRNA ligase subunit beta [Corynebacterium aquilae]|uniref:Phenylalanine--tRNA ligase beta subunit n=1 Tax=Corynebacterium aquilae DSM 44791 TaxID=1431546 RepID=A0A1L7CFR9_9CORY|nr:phenylalanine--tRNA ligase subunit beta [Corynebacterium aquilae]APT84678.1 phenylalanyl-tRNA synthetase subunit beta [Corynebacterium aquilae DSM 44791]